MFICVCQVSAEAGQTLMTSLLYIAHILVVVQTKASNCRSGETNFARLAAKEAVDESLLAGAFSLERA